MYNREKLENVSRIWWIYLKGIQEFLVQLLQNKKLSYNKWLPFIEHLLHGKPCSGCHTELAQVIPTMDLGDRTAPFYRGGNWGPEK